MPQVTTESSIFIDVRMVNLRRSQVASAVDRAYLVGTGLFSELTMPAIASSTALSRPLLFVAAAVGLLLAATLGLWAYYGTAVFFEMVRTGWVACF